MKKKFFLNSLLFIFVILAALSFSGCLGLLSPDETNPAEPDISEMYDLNVFIPIVNGNERIVESGTYFTLPKSSDVQVVRLVDNKKEIRILKETGLFGFSSTHIKDVYFITNENFSMTADGINETIASPSLVPAAYKLKENSKEARLILEENFSGILVYTTSPTIGSNSVIVNDGAAAVQVILAEGYETGSLFFGKPSPAPDSTETTSDGDKIMRWNAPTGKVSVKYYQNKAPLYFTLAGVVLLLCIALVLVRYQYQIRKLKKVTRLHDPDFDAGFRNQKNQK